ncbi:GNAT family protein [Salinicoccus sesuvii]
MNKVTDFPVLETDRLILRQVVPEDASNLLKYLSTEEVTRHMGLEPFKTIDDALEEISWYHSILEKSTGIRWGITLKDQGEVIGSCGFLNIAAKHHRGEIGFELSKDYWGQGIAGEALKAVVGYGFRQIDLQRIEALIEPLNIPSKSLQKDTGLSGKGYLVAMNSPVANLMICICIPC